MGKGTRSLIVGDIHGCFEELQLMIEKTQIRLGKDRIILVGDLINKGPYSFETLKWAKTNKIECVIGNHELKFLNMVDMGIEGPTELEQLIVELGQKTSTYVEWIKSWPSYIDDLEFLVVHGGLEPGKHPKHSTRELLASIRTWDSLGENLNSMSDPPWYDFYKGNKPVIYGHWATQGLNVRENTIGLDSGCVYGKKLSAVEFPGRVIHQIEAKRVYKDPMG